MIWASRRRRRIITVALLLGLVVAAVIVSGTHSPRPGAGTSYTGTVVVQSPSGRVLARLPVGFAISHRGERVVGLTLRAGPPRACARTLPGRVVLAPVSTPVVGPDIFRLRTAILAAGPAAHRTRIGTLEVSGAFHLFGRVSGALAARYNTVALRGCDARGGFIGHAAS